MSMMVDFRRRLQLEDASKKVHPLLRLLLPGRHLLTPFDAGRVVPPGARRIGALVPLPATADGRADQFGLVQNRLIAADQFTVRTHPFDPIQMFHDRPG